MAGGKSKEVWAFGDFQTPDELANQVMATLLRFGIQAESILEPTCGKGSLLLAALNTYPHAQKTLGFDINSHHLEQLREKLVEEGAGSTIELAEADFFDMNWRHVVASLPQPILIIGNPPWVTNSELSMLRSENTPRKTNFQRRSGIAAVTGKSNFDISEWMILQKLGWMQQRTGTLAILCKTAVARKVLRYAWREQAQMASARIFKIDAKRYFDAAVDACLLLLEFDGVSQICDCAIYANLSAREPVRQLGYCDGMILFDVDAYRSLSSLANRDPHYTWRSGIKHDCASVMELTRQSGDGFINGDGFEVSLEENYTYPLLKSSDIGNQRTQQVRKYLIVPQRTVGEDTHRIREVAPKTWDYLQANRERLAQRSSSIYRNRPPFSIFGVGDYTYAPWKVAISGFYKKLDFAVIGPIENKPVVFDDTVYFLACSSQPEAEFVAALLNSETAAQFFHAMIFWEDKRPITIEILQRLNIQALASALGREREYRLFAAGAASGATPEIRQMQLL